MDKLLSNGLKIQSVPESYILPPDKRPGNSVVPLCRTVPVVDLGGDDGQDRVEVVRQIVEASQEFGIFQVINHGVPGKMIHDTLSVAKEFFEMSIEDKAKLYSEDHNQTCRLFTSLNYSKEEIHYWRDVLTHPCHPVEEYMHLWPEKPTRYREVVQTYSIEMRELGLKLLELISEGLGLEFGYFSEELSQVQLMSINHYPPCPDPNLTLGLPKHCDINLISLLYQGNEDGLQVFKDGQWIAVGPLPNAFVVNLGLQLQIISNGKLRSAEHRVVTNSSVARTSVGSFLHPSMDSIIEPAQPLVSASSPARYSACQYMEFRTAYRTNSDAALELFGIHS